jgi:hypothetical protein
VVGAITAVGGLLIYFWARADAQRSSALTVVSETE